MLSLCKKEIQLQNLLKKIVNSEHKIYLLVQIVKFSNSDKKCRWPQKKKKNFKENFMTLFYGWGSTTSRLEPLWGGSLLFTTKSPEDPGTHFINLGRMKGWVHLGATQWFWTRDPWIGKRSALTTRLLLQLKLLLLIPMSRGVLISHLTSLIW